MPDPPPPQTSGRSTGALAGRLSSQARRGARHLVDKIAGPYVDETVRRLQGPSSAELPEAFTGLQGALHEARTLALSDMPSGADTVLSAGPNGSWYFEWFERAYGQVPRHIGVEAYAPRPPSLPANVEWVEADISGPEGAATIESDGIDLVYSGQNIEHLWPEQVEAFLLESHRVLTDGGWLVLDSPNRRFTAAYRWSMGEHTVEFTPEEAAILLGLAGFDVVAMKGLWLCRQDGTELLLGPQATVDGVGEVLHRIVLATNRPADSFLWWAEARKVREPDVPALRHAIEAVFAANWRERVARMHPIEGPETRLPDGRPGVVGDKGRPRGLMIGPYLALRPGAYRVGATVSWSDADQPDQPVARLEVRAEDQLLGQGQLVPGAASGAGAVSCELTVDRLRFGVHAVVTSTGAARVEVPLTLDLSPDPYGSTSD